MSDIKDKMHQIRFRLRLRPRPRWGAYSAPPGPRPSSWWERAGCPLLKHPTPLTAFRASIIYTKFVQLILTKIIIIDVTRCQILRLIAPNSIAAGALPQIPLGSLQLSPDPLAGGEGLTAPTPRTHPALGSSGLAASVRAWNFFTNISP